MSSGMISRITLCSKPHTATHGTWQSTQPISTPDTNSVKSEWSVRAVQSRYTDRAGNYRRLSIYLIDSSTREVRRFRATQLRRALKSWRERSYKFPTDTIKISCEILTNSYRFLTEIDWIRHSTQNFRFAVKFSQSKEFQYQIMHLGSTDEHFSTRRLSDTFPTAQNFGVGAGAGFAAACTPCYDTAFSTNCKRT